MAWRVPWIEHVMERRMNHTRKQSHIALLLVLFLGGCSAGAPQPIASPVASAPSSTPTASITTVVPATALPSETPRFEPMQCAFDAEQSPGYVVDCGFVVVPMRHRDPAGPTIRLAVARFRSQSSAPAPDPVIYLEGGPGGRALIDHVTAQIAYTFTPRRDFIAFDQRGVGYSDPALGCPELAQQTREELMRNESATEELAHEVAARFRCRDRLQSQGIDLAAYNTTESAADVNDIRLALGYSKLDLFGASYGTRLALTVMRDFPAVIRSVVLDSVEPPQVNEIENLFANTDQALTLDFQECVASKACVGDVPTLIADFNQAVADLNAHPLALSNVVLTGDRFSSHIVSLLGAGAKIGGVPALIEAAKRRDENYLGDALAYYGAIGTLGNSVGMSTSVVCNDVVPFNSKDRTIAAAQRALPGTDASELPLALSYFDMCAGWPSNPPDARNHQAVTSDLPTLILESADDPATPPANGQLAAQTLSKSVYVETPGVGHTVMGTNCGRTVIASFVADPTAKPDTGCVASMGVSYASTAIHQGGLVARP